jgi:hypothetical protein
MASLLPTDFLEFLKLLNARKVEYLVIGGYAVGYHGYPRATGDIDIWIPRSETTAGKMVEVFADFGFTSGVTIDLFLRERGIVRLGIPPNRLEVTTYIDGVEFLECFERRVVADIQGEAINFLGLNDLRVNKRASGRLKDLADLENLPSE